MTLEDWNSAFGPEFSWVGDWPANSHWPSLFAALPVKDSAKANKILTHHDDGECGLRGLDAPGERWRAIFFHALRRATLLFFAHDRIVGPDVGGGGGRGIGGSRDEAKRDWKF